MYAKAVASGPKPGGAGGGQSKTSAKANASKQKTCQSLVGHQVVLQVRAAAPPQAQQQQQQQQQSASRQLQGIVYAVHDNVLVLQEPSGVRLIHIETLMNKPVDKGCKIADLKAVSHIDDAALKKEFDIAKERRQKYLANRNPKASALARRIFDELQKTYCDCSWDGTTICIENLGNLRISEPYSAASITGTSERAVSRVKMIVQQMQLSASSPTSGASAAQ